MAVPRRPAARTAARDPRGGRLRAAQGQEGLGRPRVPGPRGAAADSPRACVAAVPGGRGPGERPAVEPVGVAPTPRWTRDRGQRRDGRPRLPSGSTLDVSVLLEGTSAAAVELPGLGRELLEGINVEASPGFDAWLLGERRRLQGLGGAVLREGALRALAAGDTRGAVALATRLLGADPLSEDAHVLLVRAFAATGDEVAVERQLAASVDLFQREFGIDIAPELYGAARMETRGRGDRRRSRRRRGAPGVRRGGDRGRCLRPRARRAPRRRGLGVGLGRDRGGGRRAARLGLGARPRGQGEGRGRVGRAAPGDARRRVGRGSTHRGGGATRARLRRAAARRVRAQHRVAQARAHVRRRRSARAVVDPRGDGREPERHRQARAGDRGVRDVDGTGDGGRQRTRARVDPDVLGPRPVAARRARGRAGHAVDRARAHARRALDRLPVLSRGAARRGVGPARRPGCRGRAVRARVHARLLGGRRVLGGVFRPGDRPAGRRARRPRRRDRATRGRARPVSASARHAHVDPRLRAGRAVRHGDGRQGRARRRLGGGARSARGALRHVGVPGARLPLPRRSRRSGCARGAGALAGGVENPHLQGMLDAAGPPMLEVLLGA